MTSSKVAAVSKVAGTVAYAEWVLAYRPAFVFPGRYARTRAPGGGHVFGTSGTQLERVLYALDADPRKVWSLLQKDGRLVLVNEMCEIGCKGHLIATVPCVPGGRVVILE